LNSSVESELEWLREFVRDFRKRFLSLLSYKFREFGSVTALSILEAANVGIKGGEGDQSKELDSQELAILLTPFDLKRLESYANNMLDYHVILDLLPIIASLFFQRRLGDQVRLTAVQSSILLALGLQRKTIEDVEAELHLPVSQALALFVKIVRKISNRLIDIQKAAINAQIPEASSTVLNILPVRPDQGENVTASLDKELEDAGKEVESSMKERQRQMLDSLDLKKYAIDDASADWNLAEAQVANNLKGSGIKGVSTVVSVKATVAAGQKRKLEESVDGGGRDKKKPTRRGKKVKH